MSGGTCNAPEGCDNPSRALGLCNKHYLRLKKRGTLEEAQLPSGQPGERWVPVPGFEDSYLISNYGQVWSKPRSTARGGILKQVVDKRGYYWVNPCSNGKQQRPQTVHRLVMLAFVGVPEKGQEVRHLDGDPGNNRWEPGDEEEARAAGGNLIYGTHAENMADMAKHGSNLVTARETHCPNGHEYTPENTRSRQRGGFACKQCTRDYHREYQRELRRKQRENRESGDEAA